MSSTLRIRGSLLAAACAFSLLEGVAQTEDPWNTPANAEQAGAFAARFPAGAIIVVPESRDHPIRLLDAIPSAWTGRPDDSLAAFEGEARPGEYFVFQICVYAAYDSLGNVRFSCEGLGGAGGRRIDAPSITCFNTGGTGYDGRRFTRRLNVRQGRLQPLWVGIQVPTAARGSYNGVMTVSADNLRNSSLRVTLDVPQGGAPSTSNRADSGVATLSRLRWLNSTIGADERATKGYTQIRRAGNSYRILGREVTIGDDGLPESISSFFTGSNQDLSGRPAPVLQGPMRFVVETSNGSQAELVPGGVTFTKSTPRALEWESTSSGGDLDLACSAHAEFDGSLEYHCVLSARRDMQVKDVRLELPLAMARYMMGLGRMGGLRPDRYEWTWDVLKNDQDMVWLGNVNGGIRLRLKSENYRRPLINVYYGFRPLNLPVSWGNGGKGSIAITSAGDGALVIARSGPRVLRMGEQLAFDFDLLVTPFHTMNRTVQFNDRYYHTSSELSAGYLPDAVVARREHHQHPSEIGHQPLHQLSVPGEERPVPPLVHRQRARERGQGESVLHDARAHGQLPGILGAPEPERGSDIPRAGQSSRTVIHPDGPPAWMIENLKEDYSLPGCATSRRGGTKGCRTWR